MQEYVDEKLSQAEAAEIARGIMVAGFSDQSAFNEEVLTRFAEGTGLPGCAYKAALYACERNCWSRHWYSIMCATDNAEEFWQASVLFIKIVDGRFTIWSKEHEKAGRPISLFCNSVEEQLSTRFKKWSTARTKKLFGEHAPQPIFLHGADMQSHK